MAVAVVVITPYSKYGASESMLLLFLLYIYSINFATVNSAMSQSADYSEKASKLGHSSVPHVVC